MDDIQGWARLVMGVVNVTDDSFSDGRRFLDADRAVEHGLALASAVRASSMSGVSRRDRVPRASTRPGETARDPPVVKGLVAQGVTPVSVDTMRAEVARAIGARRACRQRCLGWARRSGQWRR